MYTTYHYENCFSIDYGLQSLHESQKKDKDTVGGLLYTTQCVDMHNTMSYYSNLLYTIVYSCITEK